MNDFYFGLPILRAILKNPEKSIVVTPQIFWFSRSNFKNLLSNGRQDIVLFCREKYSFDILSDLNLPNNVEVSFSKDNALYLPKHDLNRFVSSKDEGAHGIYNLVCLRRDEESVILGGERRRIIRMARKGANKLFMGDIAKWKFFGPYVSAVANVKRIYTGRLHVAILAHIFGRGL